MHFYEFLSEKKTSGKGCAINVSLGDIFFHMDEVLWCRLL